METRLLCPTADVKQSADPKLEGLLKKRLLRSEGLENSHCFIRPAGTTSACEDEDEVEDQVANTPTPSKARPPALSPAAADIAAGSPHFSLETPPTTPPGRLRGTEANEVGREAEEEDKLPSSDEAEDEMQYELQFDIMNHLPHEKAVSLVNLLKDSNREKAQAKAVAGRLQRRVSKLEESRLEGVSFDSQLVETQTLPEAPVSTDRDLQPSCAASTPVDTKRRSFPLHLLACVALAAAFTAGCAHRQFLDYAWLQQPFVMDKRESALQMPNEATNSSDVLREDLATQAALGSPAEINSASGSDVLPLLSPEFREELTAPLADVSPAESISVNQVSTAAESLEDPAPLGNAPEMSSAEQVVASPVEARPTDQAHGFKMTHDGHYCKEGTDITVESQCQSAAKALGLEWAMSWSGAGDHKYCLIAHDHRNKVYFNTASQVASSTPIRSYASICSQVVTHSISAELIGKVVVQLHHAALSEDVAAPSDATGEMSAAIGHFPLVQKVHRLARVFLHKAAFKKGHAVVTTMINLGNDGAITWPAATRLRLVVGPDMGLPILPINVAIPPGSHAELTLQFEIPSFEDAGTLLRSGWVLERGNEPFGPLLLLEAQMA